MEVLARYDPRHHPLIDHLSLPWEAVVVVRCPKHTIERRISNVLEPVYTKILNIDQPKGTQIILRTGNIATWFRMRVAHWLSQNNSKSRLTQDPTCLALNSSVSWEGLQMSLRGEDHASFAGGKARKANLQGKVYMEVSTTEIVVFLPEANRLCLGLKYVSATTLLGKSSNAPSDMRTKFINSRHSLQKWTRRRMRSRPHCIWVASQGFSWRSESSRFGYIMYKALEERLMFPYRY